MRLVVRGRLEDQRSIAVVAGERFGSHLHAIPVVRRAGIEMRLRAFAETARDRYIVDSDLLDCRAAVEFRHYTAAKNG
jgi:hypothetical protein